MCTCMWPSNANLLYNILMHIYMHIIFWYMLIDPTWHGNLESFVEVRLVYQWMLCQWMVSTNPTRHISGKDSYWKPAQRCAQKNRLHFGASVSSSISISKGQSGALPQHPAGVGGVWRFFLPRGAASSGKIAAAVEHRWCLRAVGIAVTTQLSSCGTPSLNSFWACLENFAIYLHTHTHVHTYIYIYI